MPVALLKGDYLEYRCPACGWHDIPVKIGEKLEKFWEWNGDLERPTISPSVKHFHNGFPADERQPEVAPYCCHYFIKNGNIEYCGDCSHDKAGQTMALIPFTDTEVKLHNLSL